MDSEVHPPCLACDDEDACERDDSEDWSGRRRRRRHGDVGRLVETRNAVVGVRVGQCMLRERPIGLETVREDKSKAGREGVRAENRA